MASVGTTRQFYACYLLASVNPSYEGHCYIGFTIDPLRRLRQHNGEITQGAKQTKKKRPWEQVLILYGFPSKTAALQFEWAWQHPKSSRFCREAAREVKRVGHAQRLRAKLRFCFELLNSMPFCGWPLTLHWITDAYHSLLAGVPAPPHTITVNRGPVNKLPLYVHREARRIKQKQLRSEKRRLQANNRSDSESSDDKELFCCGLCYDLITDPDEDELECPARNCPSPYFHTCCLAQHLLFGPADSSNEWVCGNSPLAASSHGHSGRRRSSSLTGQTSGRRRQSGGKELTLNRENVHNRRRKDLIPTSGPCPSCSGNLTWSKLIMGQATYI